MSLLGRGGMGEVYRADDLTLDQPVALKFLPDGVAASDVRLALVVGLVVLLLAVNNGQILTGNWVGRFNAVAFTTLITVVIHRFGLVAAAALSFVDNMIAGIPMTTDLTVWWATPTLLTVPLVCGLAAFAYYASRGGEPLLVRSSRTDISYTGCISHKQIGISMNR